ncbi:MAG: ferric iron uptake transcriptional regulator [Gammaproteobacteria bacterium]|nr:ferric iron uptake transcriptional regulator [Gammaproteobacteria bacterium]MBU1775738.1 ferric iron uptake transcriptional regulator [Gammaproteobacteria bacterium]MBU1969365.1 ferric iron uptake transcriptional regulator [Gammaproteobacteria bacterium]
MESEELRNVGLKVTTPRLKILGLLEKATARHMTAESIYRQLTESGEVIGLATVYRALAQFEAAGLITRHHFEGGQTVYELERGPHHDHIVCVRCGRVEEFYDKVIEDRQREIATKLGFNLSDHALTLYGECSGPDCAGKKKQG